MLARLDPAWPAPVSVAYVMAAQALSGIAKDLTKMSAKSTIKLLVPAGSDGTLFRWVARLTGSKNALKGAGFFLGGLLLTILGFVGALDAMAGGLSIALIACRPHGCSCSEHATCGSPSGCRFSWRNQAGRPGPSAPSWRSG